MIANMSIESSDIKAIGKDLSAQAWARTTQLFKPELLHALFAEACLHEAAQSLSPASTGNNEDRAVSALRGDSSLWLDDPRCGMASKSFLDKLDILRNDLNELLLLGLESVEAHYSIYPVGSIYSRHRDRFRNDDARILSLVCYLNPDWPETAGGHLRLYLKDGDLDIAPQLGTSVIFSSEEIEHEVMPSAQTRYSIAAWFRRREIQIR